MMYVCPAGAWMMYDGVPWTPVWLLKISCAVTCTTSNLPWEVARGEESSSLVTVPSLLTATEKM